MSSGGSNKKNLSTTGFKYLDSFGLNKSYQAESKIGLCINRVNHTVSLSKVSNNYGGRNRIYFICPRCKTRVRLLYISGRYLFCRHCTKMSYPSQRCAHKSNNFKRLVSLFRKLNAENNYGYMLTHLPDRPLNIPDKTYLDLIGRIRVLQDQQAMYLYAKLRKIREKSLRRGSLTFKDFVL